MPECLGLRWNAGTTRRALGQESAPWSHFVVLLTLIFAVSTALAQQLPPGGTTSWEIQGSEEIVTFVLFDPKAPGVSLPVAFDSCPLGTHGCPR